MLISDIHPIQMTSQGIPMPDPLLESTSNPHVTTFVALLQNGSYPADQTQHFPFFINQLHRVLFQVSSGWIENHMHRVPNSWMLFVYGYSTCTLIFLDTRHSPQNMNNNCDRIHTIASTRVDQDP